MDKFRLPSSLMVPYETPDRSGPKTFEDVENIALYNVQSDNEPPVFKSRFKSWMRAVALAIVLIFLPEQASWAFSYNPMVLWGGSQQDQEVIQVSPDASPEELTSARIASSVNNLLQQVAYKTKTSVKLSLPDSKTRNEDIGQRNIVIEAKRPFNRNRIRQFAAWLQQPEIHPLNCGVYVLKDILEFHGVRATLEEISVTTLMVDILNDVIAPGDSRLKTSLFAINSVVNAYGFNYTSAKLDPKDILKLNTPFVANFDDEHFVTVTGINNDSVNYIDIGRNASEPKENFVSKLSGFVLATGLEGRKDIAFENVPDSLKTFIWGSAWVDKSDELPGLVGDGNMWKSIAIQVVGAIIAAILCPYTACASMAGFLAYAALSMAASQFASTLAEVCVMKGVCSQQGGMILSIAVASIITIGMGSWSQAGVQAAQTAGTETLKQSALQTYVQSVKETVSNLFQKVADFFAPITNALSSAWNAITGAFSTAWSGLFGAAATTTATEVAKNSAYQFASTSLLSHIITQSITQTVRATVMVYFGEWLLERFGVKDDDIIGQALCGIVTSVVANAAMNSTVVIGDSLGLNMSGNLGLIYSAEDAKAVADQGFFKSLGKGLIASVDMKALKGIGAQLVGIGARWAADKYLNKYFDLEKDANFSNLLGSIFAGAFSRMVATRDERANMPGLTETLTKYALQAGLTMALDAIEGDKYDIKDGDTQAEIESKQASQLLNRSLLLLGGFALEGIAAYLTADKKSIDNDPLKDDQDKELSKSEQEFSTQDKVHMALGGLGSFLKTAAFNLISFGGTGGIDQNFNHVGFVGDEQN
ncbi:MAG: hypothetical protein KKD07_07810, partial [Candidatus Omnitrophica bacterium]|nr:hypothetical protein [Candidatus Omnitrophota bacterium]